MRDFVTYFLFIGLAACVVVGVVNEIILAVKRRRGGK